MQRFSEVADDPLTAASAAFNIQELRSQMEEGAYIWSFLSAHCWWGFLGQFYGLFTASVVENQGKRHNVQKAKRGEVLSSPTHDDDERETEWKKTKGE